VRDTDGYWPRDIGFAGAVAGVGAVDTSAWKSQACPECGGGPQVGAAFQLHFGYNLRRRLHVVGGCALVESDPTLEGGQSADARLRALAASLGVQYALTPRWSARSMAGIAGLRATAYMDAAPRSTSAPIPAAWASIEYKLMDRPMRAFALSLDTTLFVVDDEPVVFAFLSAVVRFHLPRLLPRSDT
jgi:hypothetical protein